MEDKSHDTEEEEEEDLNKEALDQDLEDEEDVMDNDAADGAV